MCSGLKALCMIASYSSRSKVQSSWSKVSWVCVRIGVTRLIGMVAQCKVGCGVDFYLDAVCYGCYWLCCGSAGTCD
jgi:hypothetical protein